MVTDMQEREAALEQARAEAERLGPALLELQELRARHQDMCERCGAPILRTCALRPCPVTALPCQECQHCACCCPLRHRQLLCQLVCIHCVSAWLLLQQCLFRFLHQSVRPSMPEVLSMDCAPPSLPHGQLIDVQERS